MCVTLRSRRWEPRTAFEVLRTIASVLDGVAGCPSQRPPARGAGAGAPSRPIWRGLSAGFRLVNSAGSAPPHRDGGQSRARAVGDAVNLEETRRREARAACDDARREAAWAQQPAKGLRLAAAERIAARARGRAARRLARGRGSGSPSRIPGRATSGRGPPSLRIWETCQGTRPAQPTRPADRPGQALNARVSLGRMSHRRGSGVLGGLRSRGRLSRSRVEFIAIRGADQAWHGLRRRFLAISAPRHCVSGSRAPRFRDFAKPPFSRPRTPQAGVATISRHLAGSGSAFWGAKWAGDIAGGATESGKSGVMPRG